MVYINDSDSDNVNSSLGAITQLPNLSDEEYLDVSQNLNIRPKPWMDGHNLTCMTNHTAWNSTHDDEDKSVSIKIIVQGNKKEYI